MTVYYDLSIGLNTYMLKINNSFQYLKQLSSTIVFILPLGKLRLKEDA